jgi:hypothetical protein
MSASARSLLDEHFQQELPALRELAGQDVPWSQAATLVAPNGGS